MYVCMYVGMYTYTYIHTHIYVYARKLQDFGRLTRVRARLAPANTGAYVSIRQHTSAYVITREHTRVLHEFARLFFLSCTFLRAAFPTTRSCLLRDRRAYVSIRQHTSAHAPFLRAVFPTIRACLLRDRRARLMRVMPQA